MSQVSDTTPQPADPAVRPFADLSNSGLLWLINRVVLHPRGYALAVHYQGDQATGWQLLGDGTEPWSYDVDEPAKFAAAEATLRCAGSSS